MTARRTVEIYAASAEAAIWREDNGYWSARVVADVVSDQPEWRAAATAFHDADAAMEWARSQIGLALNVAKSEVRP